MNAMHNFLTSLSLMFSLNITCYSIFFKQRMGNNLCNIVEIISVIFIAVVLHAETWIQGSLNLIVNKGEKLSCSGDLLIFFSFEGA